MRVDFLADPALAERWQVMDAETGEEITNVAWVDQDIGLYATVKARPRTMSDPPNTDLRIRSENGQYALQIHRGELDLVERHVHPLKAEFLALLDDPDVAEKIKTLIRR